MHGLPSAAGPDRKGVAIAGIIVASIRLLVSAADAVMGAWMALNGQHPLLHG